MGTWSDKYADKNPAILIKADCSNGAMEVLKSISAVLRKAGRRLIRVAQTPGTCHDLEIRL